MNMSEKPEPFQVPTDPYVLPASIDAIVLKAKTEPEQDSHTSIQEIVEEPSYPTKVKFALIFGALALSTFVIGFVSQASLRCCSR